MNPSANQQENQQQEQEGGAVGDDSGFDRGSITSSTREARVARAERWMFSTPSRMDQPSSADVNLTDFLDNVYDNMFMAGNNFLSSVQQLFQQYKNNIRVLGETEYGSPRHVMRVNQNRAFLNSALNRLMDEVHFAQGDMNGFDTHAAGQGKPDVKVEVKDEPLPLGTGSNPSSCGTNASGSGPGSIPSGFGTISSGNLPVSSSLSSYNPAACSFNSSVSGHGQIPSSIGRIASGPTIVTSTSTCSRPGSTWSGPITDSLDSKPSRSQLTCPPDILTTGHRSVQEEQHSQGPEQDEHFSTRGTNKEDESTVVDEIGIDIKYEDESYENGYQVEEDFMPSTPGYGQTRIMESEDDDASSTHAHETHSRSRIKVKQESTPCPKSKSKKSGTSSKKKSFQAENPSTPSVTPRENRIPCASIIEMDPKLQAVCKVIVVPMPIQTVTQFRSSSTAASELEQPNPTQVSVNGEDATLRNKNVFSGILEQEGIDISVQPSSPRNELEDLGPVVHDDSSGESDYSDDSLASVDSLKHLERVLASLSKPTRYSSDDDGEPVGSNEDILASKPTPKKLKKKKTKRRKRTIKSDSDSSNSDWKQRFMYDSDFNNEMDDGAVDQDFGRGLFPFGNPDLSGLLPSPLSQQSDAATVAQDLEDNEDDLAKRKVLFGSDDGDEDREMNEPKKPKSAQPQSNVLNKAGPSAPRAYTPRIRIPGMDLLNSLSSDASTADIEPTKRKVLKKKPVKKEIVSDTEDDGSDEGRLPIPHKRIKRMIKSDFEDESTVSGFNPDSDKDTVFLDTRRPKADSNESLPKKRKHSYSVVISSDSGNEPPLPRLLNKKPKSGDNLEVVNVSSSISGEDDDCQVIEMSPGLGSSKTAKNVPALPGRRNIRAVIGDKELSLETQEIEKAEAKRQLFIEAKRKEVLEAVSQIQEQENNLNLREAIVLDVNSETKEPVVVIHDGLARKLKEHQIEGIKFMWDACYTSATEVEKEGSGCILAHCMGLGKSFQVIAFLHAIMTSEATKVKSALIVCPVNAAANWDDEFEKWQSGVYPTIQVYKFWSDGTCNGSRTRYAKLKEWTRNGGVGIINYDALAALVIPEKISKADSKRKRLPKTPAQLDIISAALISPGPDIIICDEGHVLKNIQSNRARAVNQFRSKRRVILTGTPLQNNLMEYFGMVELVKPGLIGSKEEFTNRFENPIKNGQHLDSLPSDVKLMKQRSHVLHGLVQKVIHRRGLKVLKDKLPRKFDYALNIKLTPDQVSLYTAFGDWIEEQGMSFGKGLFKYFHEFVRIISHPWALQLRNTKEQKIPKEALDKGNALDFVLNENERKELQLEKEDQSKDGKELEDPEKNSRENFFSNFFPDENKMKKAEMSLKLLVLKEILEGCEKVGDKVLLFSQYMFNLDMIEHFLMEWSREEGSTANKFVKDKDFFRLDGNVGVADRRRLIRKFNANSSRARLFLISTNAGSLGINLVSANRVVMFDTSWNPSADLQGVFRAYRFGQTKPCYVYRLISKGTLEERIYERQIVKLSLSCRVVDNEQMKRHFFKSLKDIYKYREEPDSGSGHQSPPEDNIVATILSKHPEWDLTYKVHDSFLEDQENEKLTKDEKTEAWEQYKNNTNPINIPPPKKSKLKLKSKLKAGQATELSDSTSTPSTSNPLPTRPVDFSSSLASAVSTTFQLSNSVQFSSAPVQIPGPSIESSVPQVAISIQQVREAIQQVMSEASVLAHDTVMPSIANAKI